MTAKRKIAQVRLDLLQLAERINNVTEACKRRGVGRSQFYEYKRAFQQYGFAGLTKDDILGNLLYTTAMSYNAEMDVFDVTQARMNGIVSIRIPSEAIFKTSLSVEESWGVPVSAGASGFAMDVDRLLSMDKALDGNNGKKVQFAMASGYNSSSLEHSVPEQLFSTPQTPTIGISAVKALQYAAMKGIPIYSINSENISAVLPQLQLDNVVIDEIRNAVNAGKEVTAPKSNIRIYGWSGCGFIVTNPTTGEAAYLISGNENGAAIVNIAIGAAALLYTPFEAIWSSDMPNTQAAWSMFYGDGIVALLNAIRGFYYDVTLEFWDSLYSEYYWGTNVCILMIATGIMSFILAVQQMAVYWGATAGAYLATKRVIKTTGYISIIASLSQDIREFIHSDQCVVDYYRE